MGLSNTSSGTITVQGSPTIYGNTDSAGSKNNLAAGSAAKLVVNDLGTSAKIGFYNSGTLCNENVQFATGAKTASSIANLSGAFVNDKDSSLVSAPKDTTSTAIVWLDAVCKISRAAGTYYYASLKDAVAGAQTGETIEIFKSCKVSTEIDTKDKNLTFKNITAPKNDAEDPAENGSSEEQPVVTFEAAGRLLVNSNVELKGVIFDGALTARTTSAVLVSAGYTLTVNDGVAGTHPDGTALVKTSTLLENFLNTNTTSTTTGGGLLVVKGTVNFNAGTVKGCVAKVPNGNSWNGGGNVASIQGGGTFNLVGGSITENGEASTYANANHPNSCFYMPTTGCTFNMTGGSITNNVGTTGAVISSHYQTSVVSTINFLGGEVSGNTAWGLGSLCYYGGGTLTIGGTVKIKNNHSTEGGVVDMSKTNLVLNLSGTAEISGNTCDGSSSGVGAAIMGADTSYVRSDGTINVSGSPIVYGNTGSGGIKADVWVNSTANIKVSDLGQNAKIGVYTKNTGMDGASEQFATGSKNACTIANLGGSFVNDLDTSLISGIKDTTTTAIIWTKAVCKIARGAYVLYYESLDKAIAGAQTGETIEILKSHSVAASMDTTGKNLTIKNVTNPKNDSEDPTENGSTDAKPVVTFGAAGRLLVNSTIVLQGVIFNGASTNRTVSGILVSATYSLTVNDGVAGTHADGTALAKTDTVLKNFVNTSTTDASGGGLFWVGGTLTVNGGTITGCKAAASSWAGGGGVALVSAGTFKFTGGTITANLEGAGGYCGGQVCLKSNSTFNMTGGTASNNGGNHGAFITVSEQDSSTGQVINITGGKITGNTSSQGGGAMYPGNATCTIGGTAEITNNYAGRCGGALETRTKTVLIITGSPKITGNSSAGTSNVGAAIEGVSYTNEATSVTISGNPIIKDNTGKGGITANLNVSTAAKLLVGDMGANASVGYYNSNTLCNANVQFATANGKNANKITNLTSAFKNDKNTSLKAISGGGTKIVWGSPVCKLVTSTNEAHYPTIAAALTDATAGATTERIEIYKTHVVTASMDTSNKSLTIMNIVNPNNDDENPTLNGSADAQPVVYFTDGTTKAQLQVNSNITLQGVKFNGYKQGGTAVTRTTPGVVVAAGKTLTIKDGLAGTLAATSTTLSNFYNSTQTDAGSGGFAKVSGTITMEGGTISGCKAEGTNSSFTGGGAVANIAAGGTFNLKGGTISGNGEYKADAWCVGPFVLKGGTFNMTGGTAKNNNGSHGGLVNAAVANSSVNISGGEILSNRCYYDGGAIYLIYANVSCSISGTAVIAKNYAYRSGGAICPRTNSTVTISGNPVITQNTTGNSSGGTKAQGAIAPLAYGDNSTVTISGSPLIWGNTNSNGSASNLNLGAAAYLKVGVMNADALVGYYSENGTQNVNTQFGTSNQASASVSGYLNAFVNDRNTTYLGTDGGGTVVKWPAAANANVKLTEQRTIDGSVVQFVHPFETLNSAIACAKALPAANMVDGAYTLEVLVNTLEHKAVATIDTGMTKPLVLTTASATATDGYKYRGNTALESGRAVVKRAFSGDSFFKFNSADGGIFTIKNCVLDGDATTYTKTSSNYNRFFWIGSNANAMLTLDNGALLRNAAAGYSGVAICVASSTSGQSIITMNNGSQITSCSSGSSGGAIYAATSSTNGDADTCSVIMNEGSQITNCSSDSHGGALFTTGTRTMLTLDGAKITGCSASSFSGAIRCTSCELKGNTEISGNTAAYAAAVDVAGTSTLTIGGNTKITGNKTTTTDSSTANAAVVAESAGNDKIVVQEHAQVYNNWDANGETGGVQRNIRDTRGSSGTDLYVGEAGLEEDAKLGVYSDANPNPGDTFAKTQAAVSKDVANLNCFFNDKKTYLTGRAGTDNNVVWGSFEPVTIKKTIPAAQEEDTWFVVQIKNTETNEVYRQAIKIPAGQTEAQETVVLVSGISYEISDASGQGTWRYEHDTVSTTGLASTDTWTAGTGDVIGTLKVVPPDSSTFNHVLTLATKEKDSSFVSETASVDNTVAFS